MSSTAGGSPKIEQSWFREVLGQYPTGVSVITGVDPEGTATGLVVGTFTSASLEPPLIAFLPAKTSTSWPKIEPSGSFCVNVLSASQEDVCRTFSRSGGNKFENLDWRPAGSGSPVLEGAVAWIDCDIDEVQDAGDHLFVLGRVRELDVLGNQLPLLFFQGGYGRFEPMAMVSGDPYLGSELHLVDVARPVMEEIAAELDARCIALALTGEQVVVLATAGRASSRTPRIVGSRTPAVPAMATLFMAYAEDARVERWLAHASSEEVRDELTRRLAEVRERGYSVGLRSTLHARYEQKLRDGQLSGRPTALGADTRQLLEELPYDPLGFTMDSAEAVGSLHAPVRDRDGRVALTVSLYPGRLHNRQRGEQCLDVLLAGTEKIEAAVR